jgi:DNA-binding YbaB/EbfC family protein
MTDDGPQLDLASLMGMAQQMGEQMVQAQDRLASTEVEGSSGGGLVRITSTGDGRFTSVSISPDAIDPDDPTMLEDLVLAALHDLAGKVTELQVGASPMGGLDLGALGLGPLGGGAAELDEPDDD